MNAEGGATGNCRLTQAERIKSKLLIDKLFGGGGSRSLAAFPIRLVYMVIERGEHEPPASIMVSVPKRCFKRAVKRNRVKRQLREAYRLNKQLLWQRMAEKPGEQVLMAFVWTDNQLHETAHVERKMRNLLTRLSEKL